MQVRGMLFVLACAVCLPGCGGTKTSDGIAGTYVVDMDHLEASMATEELKEMLAVMRPIMQGLSFTVRDDGTYSRVQAKGSDSKSAAKTINGTWKKDGDAYTFADANDATSPKKMRHDGDALVMDDKTLGQLRFKRK